MKHQKLHTNFLSNLLILVTILLLSTKWIIAQEVEDEHEFDYIKGSEKGPSHWGDLKKEWKACKNGRMQSPIDMSNHRVRVVPKLGRLKRNYKPQNATIKNRGHDIQSDLVERYIPQLITKANIVFLTTMPQFDEIVSSALGPDDFGGYQKFWNIYNRVKWEGDAGSININGTQFFLHQAHWHSPSEHTINGRRYNVELHLVHESSKINGKSKIAVIGILYKFGRPDPILTKLSKHIKALVDSEEEISIGVVNPSKIKFGGKKYYRYIGSLTVPPCTEGVIWTMNKKIRRVSKAQVKLLKEAVHDHAENNARPLQLLNRRSIQLYDQKKKE